MLRYFDISPKKTLSVFAFTGLLVALVLGTFSYKTYAYGSTPFFHSARLLTESIALSITATINHYAQGQLANALFASDKNIQTTTSTAPAQALPVLTYHRINIIDDGTGNVPLSNFIDQMNTLYRNGWHTITLSQYEQFMRGEISLPDKSFVLTFDDGAEQSFYPVDPILRVLGFTAVEYIVVAGSETEGSVYYLSPPQIHRMLATGRWEIGSHSFDAHRPYPTDAAGSEGTFYSDLLWLPEKNRLETPSEFKARVSTDLENAKNALESEYNTPIHTFAFPFGGETGLGSANNYQDGSRVTIQAAKQLYDIGWIQTERKEFTYNYLDDFSFLQQRIHVDHDWDGEELLSVLNQGMPKQLPFMDDMQKNKGWLQSWGSVRTGNVLQLTATPEQSSASSILDGSRLWGNIRMDTNLDWHIGSVFLLGNATNAKTYRTCAFTKGSVALLDVTDGDQTNLAQENDSTIVYGDNISLGMSIADDSISCTYNGSEVLRAHISSRRGGVGIQTWASKLGTATITVHNVSVQAQ